MAAASSGLTYIKTLLLRSRAASIMTNLRRAPQGGRPSCRPSGSEPHSHFLNGRMIPSAKSAPFPGHAPAPRRQRPPMTVGTDFILNALVEEGLTHLFMVPGGLVDPFLPALARHPKLQPIIATHEGGAAYMADGYARASGRFGAALGIGGPGLCNMATAVAAAKTDASPVLVLSGEIPVEMEGLGEFQDASQATLDDTAIMAPLTRMSKTVASSHALNHWLRHALTAMWAQPRGPVHLSVTHDAMTGDCAPDYAAVSGYFEAVAPLSRPAALAALDLLGTATGPKITFLAGAGVEHDNAAAALMAVA